MNCTVVEQVKKMQCLNTLAQDTKKRMIMNEEETKFNCDETKSTVTELFPWIMEFKKMCKCIHTDKNMITLMQLMQFYLRNLSVSVNECYTRPLRAAKLKDCISETLLLFLYIYREVSEDQERSVYLNNMSDLLAFYIDMELKASKKSKEGHEKISARVTSCLYVYLEHSIEYLLDTLMKIQLMSRSYHHILDPIITKIMKSIPIHPQSNLMYVRYFLLYRLWRKINEDVAVKNEITTSAIASLGPPPSTFPPSILEDVLPKVPKCQPNSTKALLQHKFDIKKCCELFLQFCRENNGSAFPANNGAPCSMNSSNRINSQVPEDITANLKSVDTNIHSITSDINKQSESISLKNHCTSLTVKEESNFQSLGSISNISVDRTTTKSTKLNKSLLQKRSRKSNQIVIIDLTSDVVLEKCIKKRKSRNLPWLEEAKKRVDLKMVKTPLKKQKNTERNTICTSTPNNTKINNHPLEDTSPCKQTTVNGTTGECAPNLIQFDSENVSNGLERNNPSLNSAQTGIDTIDTSIVTKASPVTTSSITNTPTALVESSEKSRKSESVLQNEKTCCNSERISNRKESSLNEQTVIKRLIERNAISKIEAEKTERTESVNKVCDFDTKCSNALYKTVSSESHSKHSANTSNHPSHYVVINNEKVTDIMEQENGEECGLKEDTLNSSDLSKLPVIEVTSRKTSITVPIMIETIGIPNSKATVCTNETKEIDTLAKENIEIEKPCIIGSTIMPSEYGPKTLEKVGIYGKANDGLNYEIMKQDDSQIQSELEVGNYIEVNDDTKPCKSDSAEIKESIFEMSHVNSNVRSIFRIPSSTEKQSDSKHNTRINHGSEKPDEETLYANSGNVSAENLSNSRKKTDEIPDVSLDATLNADTKIMCATPKPNDMRSISDNKCIMQDSELQDNIDGLSLLASVSQHVPHLKAESNKKQEQIKVKDYATLKRTFYSETIDDEMDPHDSINVDSQFLENPSVELINKIVGVYPEDSIDKVALHVEVQSTDEVNFNGSENQICNTITHVAETNINYDTDTLSHNLASTDNGIHSVKENANMILNGETVVLLQKSPNSNLYIINKAVENSKDHVNEDEVNWQKDKNWSSQVTECRQYEVSIPPDHVSFNLELSPYSKELPYQERKFAIGRSKVIKLEPEESNLTNLADTKAFSKKSSLPIDILPVSQQIYQDVNVLNMNVNKSGEQRKSSKTSVAFRQNIKQEFNGISNHIGCNCALQGCNGIHAVSHEVDAQHSLHIPTTHPTTLPSIYGNCTANPDLCMSYHKHCTSVSCSVQINATTSLHPHSKSGAQCGRSHCSCLNCAYDIVTHCRQCTHPAIDTHVSCLENNSYFLPTHSSVQTSTVQEYERTKSESAPGKLYDDQLLCKVENGLLKNHSLDKVEVQRESEKIFKKEINNKLPLKKRLKAHAMMSIAYETTPIKAENLNNYPGVPMMSIAALEVLEQKKSTQIVKSKYESSVNNDEASDHFYVNSSLVRRDYHEDVSNVHFNRIKDSGKNHESQFRSTSEQFNNMCHQPCSQRTFKSSTSRKDTRMPSTPSTKRSGSETDGGETTCKKLKKTQSPARQTRSSKRNVPKVNYCYTDIDPEWNPSGESKRKRKKTSR